MTTEVRPMSAPSPMIVANTGSPAAENAPASGASALSSV